MRRDARRFAGCASLGTRLRLPEIPIVNLRPLPSTSFEQQLEITLRVLFEQQLEITLRVLVEQQLEITLRVLVEQQLEITLRVLVATRSRSRTMASWRVPCGNRPCLNFPAQSREQATWRQHSDVGSILFIALFEDATPFV